MARSGDPLTLSREDLYELVWSKPAAALGWVFKTPPKQEESRTHTVQNLLPDVSLSASHQPTPRIFDTTWPETGHIRSAR
jgi:hypothetical protein